jgi:N-acetylmuramoyl-L-alanine amidase
VIDPGHGGRDPGARVKGLNEADLVLDIALRLEKLLKKQRGVEVVLTRRANVYVPLERRTALANKENADLFLSIHVNASKNPTARGLETYYLNFAPNPDAARMAARENVGSARTMHALPDIVKAIALNNKIDESREFATLIQSSLVDRLRLTNHQTRDLGVKQAPFMVLIGATMPSVLTEVSFITNRDEGRLLRTAKYRQHIADALFQGIRRYQGGLKSELQLASQ